MKNYCNGRLHNRLALLTAFAVLIASLARAEEKTFYVFERGGVKHYSAIPPVGGIPFRKIKLKAEPVRRAKDMTAKELEDAEAKTAAAEAYIDEMYRRGAEEVAREQAARAQRAEYERQLALKNMLEEEERETSRKVLLQSLRDVNQDLKNATRQPYQPFQFEAPKAGSLSPYRPPVVHCRIIGYVTTCN